MGLVVVNAGVYTTVQDPGRTGYREWGVPVGGVFDRLSAGLANALVGNSPECAVLELTLVGGTYEARESLALGLAGAPMDAVVITRENDIRLLEVPLSFSLEAGERIRLGAARAGARAYLAVNGGWQTPAVLGSRSRSERLTGGEHLPAQTGRRPTRRLVENPWIDPASEPLRIIDGPDTHFGFDTSLWAQRAWRVGPQSNRMGLRLEGDPMPVQPAPGRLSMPVAPGAVQVAGGQLIVLGVDGGTIGGYPHVAHVITADLDRLGQVRPGDVVRFRRVSLAEARAADEHERRVRGELLRRVATLAADAGGRD